MKHRPKKLTFRPAAPARQRRLNRRLLAAIRAQPKQPWCARWSAEQLRAAAADYPRALPLPGPGRGQAVQSAPFDGDLYAHRRRGPQKPGWLVLDDVVGELPRNPGIEAWLAEHRAQPDFQPLRPVHVRALDPKTGQLGAYLVTGIASKGAQHFAGVGQLRYPTPEEEAAEMARLDGMTQEQINAEFGITDEELPRLQFGL